MNLIRRCGTLLMLLAAAIALIYNLDPSKSAFGATEVAVLKYLPFAISAPAFLCFLFANRVRRAVTWSSVAIVLFVLYLFAGGAVSFWMLENPIEETFLGRSLGGFVLLATLAMACHEQELNFFLRRFTWLALGAGLIMIVEMILFRANLAFMEFEQIFHVDIVLLVGCALLANYIVANRWLRFFILFLGVLSGFISGKATGVLAAILVLSIIVIDIIKTVRRKSALVERHSLSAAVGLRGIQYGVIALILLALAAGFFYVLDYRLDAHGDTVRRFTLMARYNQFMESPIYGMLFVGNPLILAAKFLYIPSHSDIVDILAFGGLISLFLFVFPICTAVWRWIFSKHLWSNDLRNYFCSIVLVFLLIMAVNPIFALPRIMFFFWLALGLAIMPQPITTAGCQKQIVWIGQSRG